jgi:hypothetical protein
MPVDSARLVTPELISSAVLQDARSSSCNHRRSIRVVWNRNSSSPGDTGMNENLILTTCISF